MGLGMFGLLGLWIMAVGYIIKANWHDFVLLLIILSMLATVVHVWQ